MNILSVNVNWINYLTDIEICLFYAHVAEKSLTSQNQELKELAVVIKIQMVDKFSDQIGLAILASLMQ